MSRRPRVLGRLATLVLVLSVAAIDYASWYVSPSYAPPVFEDGIKQISTVEGERLAVYDGQEGFKPRFWNGVNLGAALPGHAPDEFAPTEEDDVLEVRIPWMMLGFSDPSRHEVWDNLYAAEEISPIKTERLRVYPALIDADGRPADDSAAIEPLAYEWDDWDEPNFHERAKKSYDILREAFVDEELQDP